MSLCALHAKVHRITRSTHTHTVVPIQPSTYALNSMCPGHPRQEPNGEATGVFMHQRGSREPDDGNLKHLEGVGFSSDGLVYVIDSSNNRICVFA